MNNKYRRLDLKYLYNYDGFKPFNHHSPLTRSVGNLPYALRIQV